MKYNNFKYLYPPRPEVKIPPSDLDKLDTGQYIAQPKYNGSCCVVFTNGKELHIYNRHKEPLSKYSSKIDFLNLAANNNWYVYAGEYLNKSKLGETGLNENDKFIIWDVLVWDNEYLIGQTLLNRLRLLEDIYPCERAVVKKSGLEMYEHLCCTEFTGIYKAPTYINNFKPLYDDVVKTDLYEGLVLKKIDSKLSFGFNTLNNQDWQVKCRKETKIYNF
jgi:ATP-dependent DNA ligase